ncbi:MAG: ATP-binding protein [Saprospiraceae bacterium]
MIARQIEAAIREMLTKFPILLVIGPRQAGKTTLLREMFADYQYVNLEFAANREFAATDPVGFLRQYPGKIILDEAQRVPELFSYLQVRADEDKEMGKYILSGSQNFLLADNVAQSLAGRVAIFKLLPLSHREMYGHTPDLLANNPEAAIFRGGYPALFERDIHPSAYFPSYIETYLERDVRSVTNISDLNTFRNFLRLCAGRVGQPVNYQALATEAGISQPTLKKWLNILEAGFIAFQLQPYFENFSKRLIKSPKLYFYDTGLLCHLLDLNESAQIDHYHAKGSLFENMVAAELMKNRYNAFRPASIYFWRDSNGNEVDFLVREGGEVHLVEAKFSFTPMAQFYKGIQFVREAAPQFSGRNIVLFAGDEAQIRREAELLSWRALIGL